MLERNGISTATIRWVRRNLPKALCVDDLRERQEWITNLIAAQARIEDLDEA